MARFIPDLLLLVGGVAAVLILGKYWQKYANIRLIRALQCCSLVIFLAGLIVTAFMQQEMPWAYRAIWVSGLAIVWAIVVIVGGVLSFLLRGVTDSPNLERRRSLANLLRFSTLAVPAFVMTRSIIVQRRAFRLVEVDIALPAMPQGASSITIAQLSDIHLSPFLSREDLAYCVDMANETKADLTVVTGDLITGIGDSIDDCLTELKRLKARGGIYGCMGNHERYARVEAYTASYARSIGIQFLRDQAVPLQFGQSAIQLIGVDYQPLKEPYLQKTAPLRRDNAINILLSHNPDVFPVAARQGMDLTLAGHTHGGQVNIEILDQNINPIRAFVTPYVYGVYESDKSRMYVTRGIGTIGLPVRMGAPPEVALIRLRPWSA